MNFRYVAAAVLTALSSCATLKDNAVLQQLADQDQYDRVHNEPNEGSHDAAHQRQVRQLLATRQVHTGRDYFNAALILQHADSTRDYLLANELARKAVALHPQNQEARTLVAQSWDRYQRSLGQPQWYATQYYVRNGKTYLQLLDTTKASDTDRRAYGVATLPEKLTYLNQQNNRHETSLRAYLLTNEQQRALAAQPAAAELIGSYDELFRQVRYPAAASQQGITGKVVVEATIGVTGAPNHVSVVRGLGYGCDEEALRVVQQARFSNPTGEEQEIRILVPFAPPAKP